MGSGGKTEILVADEAAQALADERPVVALESTLIAQGLPWPENLETARAAEAAIRGAGVVPATVAVIGGRARVGLSGAELERLARAPETFLKAGRRDLGYVVGRGLDAATTISATLHLARRAGIRIMSTGGLGGVHRAAVESFDVSTDLDELARAKGFLVVCSGVKSILDVPATLERLETLGVPVIGYGTNDFPGFTARTLGLRLESRVDTPREAARVVAAHRTLRLPGAIVLAQPVPEADALDRQMLEDALTAAIAAALEDARVQGISGKAVTPFLLDRLRLSTSGASLRANTALIVANAALAGQVAKELGRG
jgi:pseudouridylate synthase